MPTSLVNYTVTQNEMALSWCFEIDQESIISLKLYIYNICFYHEVVDFKSEKKLLEVNVKGLVGIKRIYRMYFWRKGTNEQGKEST